MILSTGLAASARLDFAESLRSRWVLFSGATYAVLAGAFVLFGLRESSLFGFTGMGRVLFSLCHALVLVLPLLALVATVQVVNRAREDGTLELLFSLPIGRLEWFGGVTLVRFSVLALPLCILLPAFAALGAVAGGAADWAFVGRTLAVCTSLVIAYTGIGLLLSTIVSNTSRVMIWGLMTWAASVALLDFGLVAVMLRMRLSGLAVLILGALNPVQAARLALVSGAEPELAILGPVGTFLSINIGPGGLFALGTLWPTTVGVVAWLLAARAFRKGDLV